MPGSKPTSECTSWRAVEGPKLAAEHGRSSIASKLLEFELYGFVLGVQHDFLFLGDPFSFRYEAVAAILARHGINLPPHATSTRKIQ